MRLKGVSTHPRGAGLIRVYRLRVLSKDYMVGGKDFANARYAVKTESVESGKKKPGRGQVEVYSSLGRRSFGSQPCERLDAGAVGKHNLNFIAPS
jgi:hypothetical protein